MEFLQPQQQPSSDRGISAKDVIGQSISKLRNKAYNLSVLMRKSKKAALRVEVVGPGTTITSTIEAEINPQARMECDTRNAQPSRVRQTIIGALKKSREDSSEEWLL